MSFLQLITLLGFLSAAQAAAVDLPVTILPNLPDLPPCFPDCAGNGPTLTEHRLEWATATLNENCDAFNVHIRYNCTEDPRYPFNSTDNFRRICDTLIPEGIKKYYERTIDLFGVQYEVTVTTEETNDRNQWVMLQQSTEETCVSRSSNFLVIPAFVMWCEDKKFMHTIAHELGHGVMVASESIVHSLTHKGTSTPDQVVHPLAPEANCDGSMKLEVMHYFNGYNDNCKDADGNKNDAFFDQSMMTEADVQALVMQSLEQVDLGQCKNLLGEACSVSADCLAGLMCIDESCIECQSDDVCLSDQFCLGVGAGAGHGVRRCQDRRPPGSECNRQEMCLAERTCDLETGMCQ